MYIDADTHVDECEETWEFLPSKFQHLTPRTLEFSFDDAPPWLKPATENIGAGASGSGYYRFWFVNGQLHPRRIRNDERTGTTMKTRELHDVSARLTDMERLGVQTQVIYPTIFLNEISQRSEVQVALYRSYNRWLSERCAESNSRLRWVAAIPYSSPEDALSEMEFAKANGACGIFKLGVEYEREAGDPYFYPFYRRAVELDLAVSIHTGNTWSPVANPIGQLQLGHAAKLTVLQAFSSLLGAKIYEKIPGLRVGFIESASAWLPYLFGAAGWSDKVGWSGSRMKLADMNFYITCETYEDIPYLIDVAGGNRNFVIGTDYSHGDRASVGNAQQQVMERKDLDEESKTAITSTNVTTLYALE